MYHGLNKEVNLAREELDQLNEVEKTPPLSIEREDGEEAERIIFIEDGIQMFFVDNTGSCSTLSHPSSLIVFKAAAKQLIRPDSREEESLFLQVNGWTHPLIKDKSVVLLSYNGVLMFPDIYSPYSDNTKSYVGLVILDDIVQQSQKDELLKFLQEHALFQSSRGDNRDEDIGKELSTTLGRAIVTSADWIGKGISVASKTTEKLIDDFSEKHKQKLVQSGQQEQANSPHPHVNSALKYSARGALHASTATVRVSGFLASRVGRLTKRVASHLAHQIVPSTTAEDSSGGKKTTARSTSMQKLADAAHGTLIAYGTVYNSLEEAAKCIGSSVKDNSVSVVELKYGEEAGQVYDDATTAAGNACMTYLHVSSLGAKGLVKKTAKQTVKCAGKNYIQTQ